MSGMRDVTELNNADGTRTPLERDGNLLTAVGSAFIPFGVTFCEMLRLRFEAGWYGVM